MSLHEFVKKNTPNVLQSLFRREIGLVGICGHYGKETTNTINVIIHRQLIQSRASRSPLPPPSTKSKLRKESESQSSESDNEDINYNNYGRRKPDDIFKSLRKNISAQNWKTPENSDVVVLNDIVFIRSGNSMSYIVHEINEGLSRPADLRSVYRFPGLKIWSEWVIWWPCFGGSQEHFTRQHRILFVLKKSGHVLQSSDFDSGKKIRKIYLDPEVRFKSLRLSTDTLILNSVKASIGAAFDHAVADFIVFSCPDLRLVTRCRMTKAAIGNSAVEIHGDFIYLINGHRIELFDLKETIKSSYQLEPTGNIPAEGVQSGIPCTHLVQEKPVCLYVVGNTTYSYLEIGHALWPPYYVKRDQFGKFQLLPMSESGDLMSKLVGVDFLNLVDDTVPHEVDSLRFHPDQSGRLILTGYTEIRVILMNRQNEFGIARTHFIVQFSKTLDNSTPKIPEGSRRSGMRAIRRKSYAGDICDEDRGVIRWEYSSNLDLFVILEFSSTIFQITMLDNQCWEPIALINLSDTLPPPRNYEKCRMDFAPFTFSIDVMEGFIAISQNSINRTHEKILFIINLLSGDTGFC